MTDPAWTRIKNDGIVLLLQIQPNASKTEVTGLYGDPPRLKIRVAAPPVDNKANKVLLAFLSKKLGFPKSSFEIVRGMSGKTKDVFCRSLQKEALFKLHDS